MVSNPAPSVRGKPKWIMCRCDRHCLGIAADGPTVVPLEKHKKHFAKRVAPCRQRTSIDSNDFIGALISKSRPISYGEWHPLLRQFFLACPTALCHSYNGSADDNARERPFRRRLCHGKTALGGVATQVWDIVAHNPSQNPFSGETQLDACCGSGRNNDGNTLV
jgi:hypothetical protein